MNLTAKEKRTKAKNRAARRPELGSWHTITEVAHKDRHGKKSQWHVSDISDVNNSRGKLVYSGTESPPPRKSWLHPDWQWQPDPPITSYRAMYIGYRYKFNGYWEKSNDPYESLENYFVPTETVEVWLFVTHDNRKPVAVMPFEYPPLEDEDEEALFVGNSNTVLLGSPNDTPGYNDSTNEDD